ncbi:hypothetical protein F2Q70_00001091, partial [Brassica cretica]
QSDYEAATKLFGTRNIISMMKLAPHEQNHLLASSILKEGAAWTDDNIRGLRIPKKLPHSTQVSLTADDSSPPVTPSPSILLYRRGSRLLSSPLLLNLSSPNPQKMSNTSPILLLNNLQNLAGQLSDVLENLSPISQHDELEAKFREERAVLEAKYEKLYQPIYAKNRRAFWDHIASGHACVTATIIIVTKMTGLEYVISDATEPNLFVFPKQKKDCPEKGRDIHNILMAFSADASKLETIRQVDAKNENEPSKTKSPNANTTSPSVSSIGSSSGNTALSTLIFTLNGSKMQGMAEPLYLGMVKHYKKSV